MNAETQVDFSAFKARLSSPAFDCFKVLFENIRNRAGQEGSQKRYEVPLADCLGAGNPGDIETVAGFIKEIIQCKVQISKDQIVYYFPFFAFVCIEEGMVRYSLPSEIETAVPTVVLS
jgi:hypothetical protein